MSESKTDYLVMSAFIADKLEEFEPIIKEFIKQGKKYKPYLEEFLDYLSTQRVLKNNDAMDMYLEFGFSREEAMMLIIDARIALSALVDKQVQAQIANLKK